VVFVHGNGTMVEDMLISGVFDRTAQSHRAIAIDRPGFGHRERPRGRAWDAEAQAALFAKAFDQLGIRKPVIVGHSWGTMVALALALNHPDDVSGLVLASGYYYPTARTDVVLFSPPVIPVVGDLLCYTVAPLIGEVMTPGAIKKMFAPRSVPARFAREFPTGLMLRPSQIHASSQDAAHMVTSANALSRRYGQLTCPLAILAGDRDRIVEFEGQALRLHGEVSGSTFDMFPTTGHMVHHADPARVVHALARITSSHAPVHGSA
jgi:pimeloyl-ACP methyl ester carboxylesterase